MAEDQNRNHKKNLSTRLLAVASLVTPGLVVADVGCDHGWVPIYLVGSGITPKAYAMDVRKGPLSIAKQHVEAAELQDRITLRLSDGLQALSPGEAESIIIAGMGGPLIRKILTEREETAKSADELILSPHSEWMECRVFLKDNGYEILFEQMVEEEGKFYLILKVKPAEKILKKEAMEVIHGKTPEEAKENGSAPDPELALVYGDGLLKRKDPVLFAYLEREYQTLSALEERLNLSGSEQRLSEIRRQLLLNRRAFEYINTDQSI